MSTITSSGHQRSALNPDVMAGPIAVDVTAALLSALGDAAFILSSDGRILDIALSESDLANHGFAAWVGSLFIDTVTVESRPKIAEMLAEAKAGGPIRWRQINHAAAGGDVPLRYKVMALGENGLLVAIGRDMRGQAVMQQRLLQTQQSLERDYIRLRQAEARYRLLFDMAAEPVLIVDAETRQIRQANPAAYKVLDASEAALIGKPVGTIVATEHRDDLVAHLGAAEAADDLGPVTLRLADQRGEASFSARLFRQARAPLLILRLEMADGRPAADQVHSTLVDIVERMPDSFVLVARDLTVLTANAAFLELTEMPSLDRIVGQRLGVWFGRPGIDLELVIGQLREHGSVRNVATIMRGAAGALEEIEVSGVVAPMNGEDCYGFTIRHVGRRLRGAAVVTGDTPRSVEQLTRLVGRMSLKDIVRESTDMIERLCIEAALVYTADNRASAAEVLGVSRQSLYSKLHRHGLGNLVQGDS